MNVYFLLASLTQQKSSSALPKTSYLIFLSDDRDEAEEGPSNVAQKDVTMASLVEAEVIEVGTVKPDQDFKTLLERGEDFNRGMCSHYLVLYKVQKNGFNPFCIMNEIPYLPECRLLLFTVFIFQENTCTEHRA